MSNLANVDAVNESIDLTARISINEYEFFGRNDIKQILIPKTVEVIESGAFSGCRNLESVLFEEGLKIINNGAFFGCTSLKNIELPSSLENIGEHCFSSCTSLESVSFPSSVNRLGKGIFLGCTSLESIHAEGKGKYISQDGVLFSITEEKGKVLEIFPQGKSGEYTTPDNTDEIAEAAFFGCKKLEKANLSVSVKAVGNRAFGGCPDITVIIGNKEILTGALPFEDTAHVSVETSKKKNPYAALGEVDFEEKLSNIKYIFPVSKKFVVPSETWTVSDNEDGVTIVSYNGDETEITVPPQIDGKSVTAIGDYAFSPEKGGIDKKRRDILSRIKSVFLSRNIKSIGIGAFKNCTSLEYVLVPNSVDIMKERVFSGCSSLSAVTLPLSIEKISNGMFFGCKKLESIELPKGITEIGELAFSGCERFTYLSIPESVRSIGRKSFAGCRYLMYIDFPESLEFIGLEAFKNTMWYMGRPDGVIYAANCVAGYKGMMPSVTINEGTISICDGAFQGNEWLEEIILPESLRKIGAEAFWNCSKLRSIYLPDNIIELGDRVFSGCKMLNKVRLGNDITVIPEFAFSGCVNLRNIDFPQNVQVIEREAFRVCTGLSTIKIPDGCKVIMEEAFNGCSYISEVFLPDSLTEIGQRAFVGIPNLIIRANEGTVGYGYADRERQIFMAI